MESKLFLKLRLREYQNEALKYALDKMNTVCILPTGTGKTLIGLAWACELLNKNLAKRILILEPSRYLVEQTYSYYLKNSNLGKGRKREFKFPLYNKQIKNSFNLENKINYHIKYQCPVVLMFP